MEFHLSAFISGVFGTQLKPKLSIKAIREGEQVSDTQRSLSDWINDAGDTLFDRGVEYGDPRRNLKVGLELWKLYGWRPWGTKSSVTTQ